MGGCQLFTAIESAAASRDCVCAVEYMGKRGGRTAKSSIHAVVDTSLRWTGLATGPVLPVLAWSRSTGALQQTAGAHEP
jgi:hypothetical protein